MNLKFALLAISWSITLAEIAKEICVDKTEYLFRDFSVEKEDGQIDFDQSQLFDFEEAQTQCDRLGGKLARVSTKAQHDALVSLRPENFKPDAWIGVESDVGGDGNPKNFHFIGEDQTGVEFFQNAEVGEFPWLSGEPNNFENRTENCVVLAGSGFNGDRLSLWDDRNCFSPEPGFFCEVLESQNCIAVDDGDGDEDEDTDEVGNEDDSSLSLALGAVGGILGVLAVIGVLWFVIRSRKSQELVLYDLGNNGTIGSGPRKNEPSGLALPSNNDRTEAQLREARMIQTSTGSDMFSVDSTGLGIRMGSQNEVYGSYNTVNF